MSQTPLDLTAIGMNTTNTKTLDLDLTPISTKTPYPKPLTPPIQIFKTQQKRALTRGPGVIPTIVRIIIDRI